MPEDPSDLPEQLRVRQEKRARLLAEGREAYPVSVPRTHSLQQVREQWGHLETGEETQDVVGVTGRVVFVRNTGKLCFATLQEGLTLEHSGTRLQVMLSLAEVGEEQLARWKADVDLGDFVFVRGRVISSKRGELSVLAGEWQLAAKALRPMPNLYTELSEETRVRQRYADLTVREAARDMVRTRAAITRSLRETLHADGYVEIETPVLQLVHGGANARPFRTHLNAFDIDMTLRIALELFLKRAVVGGVERVYELGRIFRNEGIDSTHSAEFTMLEVYQAWGDQRTIAALTQQLIVDAADRVGSRTVDTPAGPIDLDGEWAWLGVYPGLSETLGEEVTPETTAEHLRKIAEAHDVAYEPGWDAQKLVMRLFGDLVEPTADPADVRLRLPAAGPAAGPAAPQRPRPDRGLGPDHRRDGTGHRLLRAGRPGDPARAAHGAVAGRGRRRSRRRCSWTRTSLLRWSSARRRWAASAWESTGW